MFLAGTALASPSFLIPKRKEKLGVALVGLGYYSTDLLAPALELTKYCELKGIVTGSSHKAYYWQRKYGIKDRNVYNYENMGQIANNDEIDVVYIVLPNSLHKKYTIMGANAGKHVWCEKPMALNVQECTEMISACSKNKVQLTIGYRMQHEPNTQTITHWASQKPFGNIKNLSADAAFVTPSSHKNHWRLKKEMGGGVTYDMGVYCINAVRYATKLEPLQVKAVQSTKRPEMFDEVDETMRFELDFPEGIKAKCRTSFGENWNNLHINCQNGWYTLNPFQAYSGVQGEASNGIKLQPFKGNQQAQQMDNDALAIINKKPPIVPGEDGLKDIKVVEAIYKSASENGKSISI